ncbi:hypothetical protein HMPREF1986_00572 [Oribacterium sp. oral taxon 078 str. F0263]|nr:hypothetical protein HMPREF1986_00572 [Oribacterium sp. oral taxon 078 str. F0263]
MSPEGRSAEATRAKPSRRGGRRPAYGSADRQGGRRFSAGSCAGDFSLSLPVTGAKDGLFMIRPIVRAAGDGFRAGAARGISLYRCQSPGQKTACL